MAHSGGGETGRGKGAGESKVCLGGHFGGRVCSCRRAEEKVKEEQPPNPGSSCRAVEAL